MNFKHSQTIKSILSLRQLGSRTGIGGKNFVLPILFSLSAALLEGASVALLIPTLKGIIEQDYGFIREIKIWGNTIQILPDYVIKTDLRLCGLLVSIIFLTTIGRIYCSYTSSLLLAKTLRAFSNNLRKIIYQRYLGFGKAFFDLHNRGYLHQLLMNYIDRIIYGLRSTQSLLFSLVILLVYLAIMLGISWKLTLIVIMILPSLHYSSNWLIKRIKNISASHIISYNQLGKQLSNALGSIPLIKAYSKEKDEFERFSKFSDLTSDLQLNLDRNNLLIAPIQHLLILFYLFFIAGLILVIILKSEPSALANYMVFILILKRSTTTLGSLNNFQGLLATLDGPLTEVLKIFDEKGKYYIKSGNRIFTGLIHEIRLEQLSFSYHDGPPAIQNISFTIEHASVTALVGHTGSGKSTILNLLMRFYNYDHGKILIDGIDVKDFTLESWLSKISLVSQDTFLFNGTLRDNISYSLQSAVDDQVILDAAHNASLDDLLEKSVNGLDTLIGDHGLLLSGGERQRVAIARAILRNSEIILLDEPTSALDARTESAIQNALLKLLSGRTVIVIAHRFSTIRHANKIVVLDKGQVREVGTREELLQKDGTFKKLWEAQRF